MNYPLLFALPFIFTLQTNHPFTTDEKKTVPVSTASSFSNSDDPVQIGLQDEPQHGKMRSVVFKNQEYCRVELKDFVFDVQFKIISATIYFSGTNFREVEKATISSNSLKPVANYMKRCLPGTIVVFDDVKIKGPDNELRTIPGATYILY